MKSLFSTPLSSSLLWEFSFYLLGTYLFFFPPWTYPQSMAVALGGGLLLLLLRPIEAGALRVLGWVWVLFLGYVSFSSFWSLSPGMTLQSVGILFLGSLLYLMARANSPAGQSRLEVFGLLLAVLAALKGLHQWFCGFGDMAALLPQVTGQEHDILEAAVHNRRAFGYSATSGALAALLILFIPQGFVLAWTQRGAKRAFYGLSTLLLLAGLLATQSVGAFLCLMLGIVIVLLNRGSKKILVTVLAAGMLGIVSLVLARGIHSWLLAAFGMRLTLWNAAWGLFLQHPWFGTGLGTFAEAYQGAGLNLGTGSLFPHNILLQVMVETGLAGTLLFLTAVIGFLWRFKIPFRWEGWGVMTGGLAFLLFSLLDLPFQMVELVWLFAALAGRLELTPARKTFLPEVPVSCAPWFLGTVFLITGFWPPFRPWNFCLLAVTLWALHGFFAQKYDKVPLWIAAGALYLGMRAFFSPSAMGAVWFLEITGLLLVFFLLMPCFPKPGIFLRIFLGFGLLWALKAWWVSIHYAGNSWNEWLHFQYSDVKEWMIFPNPKQVAIVLALFVLAMGARPWGLPKVLALLGSILTVFRLRAFTGLAALLAGLGLRVFGSLKTRFRPWIVVGVVLFLVIGGVWLRSMESSSTKWERFGIWESALKVWGKSPIIGVGPGAFAGYYHQFPFEKTSGINHFLMDPRYAHNEYLDFLTAFGLAGFVFLGLLSAKAWRRVGSPLHRSALAGLGAAAFFDFCLHTPLIALQGIGLAADLENPKKTPKSPTPRRQDAKKNLFFNGNQSEVTIFKGTQKVTPSWIGGFLGLGLAFGLFGSAIFSGVLAERSAQDRAQSRYPEALRCLETAERLNAWDAQVAAQKAKFLNDLFLATRDPVWERKSDEAFGRQSGLEKADGEARLEKAEVFTQRLGVDPDPQTVPKAKAAWEEAHGLLPFNALLDFEYGLFLMGTRDKEGALLEFETAGQKEPNYAGAWVNAGLLLKEKGEKARALECFQKALQVYEQWKDAQRIDPLEKQMVDLPPATLAFLRKEAAP